MYIQITTKCQMSCAHCCFGCRPGIGQDMKRDVFEAALNIARDSGDYVTLGGGEPTLHPDFWEWLCMAMAVHNTNAAGTGPMLIVTNGADTEKALTLAGMTAGGALEAVLSQDKWHDPIDPRVVEAFRRLRNLKGGRDDFGESYRLHEGIRTNRQITNHGSAKRNKISTEGDECCCNDSLVMPNGKFFGCGCRRHAFGTVFDYEWPEDYERGECVVKFHKQGFQTATGGARRKTT